jgi:methionyl-tRNA formyltransferase
MKKNIKLRVLFMGTSRFAEKVLGKLIEKKYNLIAVFTQPDRPAGRGKKPRVGPVKALVQKEKIPLYQPEKLGKETSDQIKKLKPDIMIVAAYGKILPREMLEIPGFGCLNVHASLLPKYRGPSPIQNALLKDEKETGVTIILMNEGIDTGDIIAQKKIKISADDNLVTLNKKLAEIGAELLFSVLPDWIEGKITPQKQDDSQTTLCQLIEKKDGHIIWEENAQSILCRWRAFFPWPGIFGFWRNKGSLERIIFTKISLTEEKTESGRQPGEVFKIGEKIAVQAQNGAVILEEIKPEGKDPMEAEDFVNGRPEFIGSVLF